MNWRSIYRNWNWNISLNGECDGQRDNIFRNRLDIILWGHLINEGIVIVLFYCRIFIWLWKVIAMWNITK